MYSNELQYMRHIHHCTRCRRIFISKCVPLEDRERRENNCHFTKTIFLIDTFARIPVFVKCSTHIHTHIYSLGWSEKNFVSQIIM